jgi:hypothetical protein
MKSAALYLIAFSVTLTSCVVPTPQQAARRQALNVGATSAEADAAQARYDQRRREGYSHFDAMQVNNREMMQKAWGIGNLPVNQ